MSEIIFDKEQARQAAREMDRMRKKKLFSNKGKKSEEIIREWRDRRPKIL